MKVIGEGSLHKSGALYRQMDPRGEKPLKRRQHLRGMGSQECCFVQPGEPAFQLFVSCQEHSSEMVHPPSSLMPAVRKHMVGALRVRLGKRGEASMYLTVLL